MNGFIRAFVGIGFCAIVGCSEPVSAPAIHSTTVAREAQRVVPELRSQRFSTLLDFETTADPVFVSSHPAAAVDPSRAHTGTKSLRFDGSSNGRIVVKLASILAGREFPGEWTLLGGYFCSDSPCEITVSVENAAVTIPSQKYSLQLRAWTAVMCDLGAAAPVEDAKGDDAVLVFTLSSKGAAPLWLDDVLLVENTQTLVSRDNKPEENRAWHIRRRGLRYICESPQLFNYSLQTVEGSPNGWRLEEANELRARFASHGKVHALTAYRDGRAFWDGALKPMSDAVKNDPAYQHQHDSPAEVLIAPELGRINRSTPGDANNDGYNESRGAYEIVASGARLELQILPRSTELVQPILEVAGIPKGELLVTMQGTLVDDVVRLDDGTALIELPGRISKPTIVNLRLK